MTDRPAKNPRLVRRIGTCARYIELSRDANSYRARIKGGSLSAAELGVLAVVALAGLRQIQQEKGHKIYTCDCDACAWWRKGRA